MSGLGIGLSRPRGAAGAAATASSDPKTWLGRASIPNATVKATVDGVVDGGSAVADANGFFSYTFATRPTPGKPVSFSCTGTVSTPAVAAPADAPVKISISGVPAAGATDTAYGFTPTIANGAGTRKFGLAGDLPNGWSFSTATGTLSYSTSAAGTFKGLVISVTDDTGTATLALPDIVVSVAAVVLETLKLSGLLTSGVPSFGVINGATDGNTITSGLSGLTVDTAKRTYAWDGTGAVGSAAAALTETPASGTAKQSPAIVLPAHTGNLRPSGRQFFGGEPAQFLINAGYAATSSLTVTASDGTVFTVGVNSQGYPLAVGTFPVVTADTPVALSINELKSDGTTSVSVVYVMVSPIPVLAPAAKIQAQAKRVTDAVASRKAIVLGSTPPVISINTGNSTVNGKTLASGTGAISNASIPEGQSGLGGIPTQGQAAGGFIIGDTTNGLSILTWPNGCSRRFKFDGSHFDFRVGFSGTPPGGTAQVQVLYTEDADSPVPTWFAATVKSFTFKPALSQWFDVQFPTAPAGPGKRAVEIFFQQNVAISGFNFEAGVTPQPYSDGALTGGAWNDSFDYGQGSNDQGFFGLSGHMAMEALGSRNVYAFGHRTAAWARLAGTIGVGSYTADRIMSAPFGFDESTRFGRLDVMYGHMSINDPAVAGYTVVTTTTKFVNQNGNFVPGTDTLKNLITLAYRRMRLAQRRALIVIDCGFAGPPDAFSAAYVTTLRDIFAKVFDGDRLAIFADFTTGTYRHLGQTYSIPTIPNPPLIASGVAGSSPFFPPADKINVTGSITGDQFTVTAINTAGGRLEVGSVVPPTPPSPATPLNTVARIASMNPGTTGGVGTYTLEYAPGDFPSQTVLMGHDTQHPSAVGDLRWGQERGAAAAFLANKALAA